jgi:hypothetical protein
MEWDWVHSVRRTLFSLLYRPPMMEDDCGAVGGMIGRGNRGARRKPAPVLICPPQMQHDLARARTRAAAVGIRWVTAWTEALPRVRKTNLSKLLSKAVAFFFKTYKPGALILGPGVAQSIGVQGLSYGVHFKRARHKTFLRQWRPIGLWDVEAPTLSRQSAHRFFFVIPFICNLY